MDKSKQIKFLEDALDRAIEARLLVETDYRLLTRSAMRAKNLNDPIFSKQTELKNMTEIHDGRIYFLRELIGEIKEDKFKI